MARDFGQHVLTYTVGPESAGRRLDSLLRFDLGLSRRSLRGLKAFRGVEINGRESSAAQVVAAGDVVDLWIPAGDSAGVTQEPIELRVAYEDEHLLVVDKPAGMITHPVKRHQSGTLANGVAFYLASKNAPARSHPVNRLDKDTSGLVVFAKHPLAHDQLVLQMEAGQFHRRYAALASGSMADDEGVIDLPIAARPGNLPGRTVAAEGKPAVTRYRVVERLEGCTLVHVRLESGRTHQIRVHFAAIGHPLVGDALYARPGEWPESGPLKRQALHAGWVEFRKPFGSDPIALFAPMPEDMATLIEERRKGLRGAKAPE